MEVTLIHLLLTPPGMGKTHWLSSHNIVVDCTNTPHRATLTTLCDSEKIDYENRATIDDLLRLLLAAPPSTFAFDNIDRTSPKLLFSLLALSQTHSLYVTATNKKRVQVLIDRQSAILVPVPRVTSSQIKNIVKELYPELSLIQVEKITSIATTPASAVNLANAIASGEMKNLPIPPSKSILPVLAIVIIAAMIFMRYNYEFNPATLSLITALGFYLRRMLWKTS